MISLTVERLLQGHKQAAVFKDCQISWMKATLKDEYFTAVYLHARIQFSTEP